MLLFHFPISTLGTVYTLKLRHQDTDVHIQTQSTTGRAKQNDLSTDKCVGNSLRNDKWF